MILTKAKDKYETLLIFLNFSSESDFKRRYLKQEQVSFVKYTVMRLRHCTGRTSFHGSGERNIYIYIHIYLFIYLLTSLYGSVTSITITGEASLSFQ